MTEKTTKPTALVLLAGKQLIPNILSIVRLDMDKELEYVFIYHTTDGPESKIPAQQLHQLCREYLPNTNVKLSSEIGCDKGTPHDVDTAIQKWREMTPNCEWWINATGGTKIMFAGVLRFLIESDTTIIYSDIKKGWRRLRSDVNAPILEPISFDEACLDAVPINKLLAMQAGVAHEKLSENNRDALYKKFSPLLLTQEGIAYSWKWREVAAKLTNKDVSSFGAGFVFEQYIASILWHSGIKNLAINIEHAEGVQKLDEFDVVAIHNGKIVMIDCKLTSEDSIEKGREKTFLEQIRQASTTKKKFGGISAAYLMLRPSMEIPKVELEVARYEGLSVLDKTGMHTIIEKIFNLFGKKEIPAELQDIHELLAKEQAKGKNLFSEEKYSSYYEIDIFTLSKPSQEKEKNGQSWFAYREVYEGKIHVEGRVSDKNEANNFVKQNKALFAEEPRVTSDIFHFVFEPAATIELRVHLANRRGKSFFSPFNSKVVSVTKKQKSAPLLSSPIHKNKLPPK